MHAARICGVLASVVVAILVGLALVVGWLVYRPIPGKAWAA